MKKTIISKMKYPIGYFIFLFLIALIGLFLTMITGINISHPGPSMTIKKAIVLLLYNAHVILPVITVVSYYLGYILYHHLKDE